MMSCLVEGAAQRGRTILVPSDYKDKDRSNAAVFVSQSRCRRCWRPRKKSETAAPDARSSVRTVTAIEKRRLRGTPITLVGAELPRTKSSPCVQDLGRPLFRTIASSEDRLTAVGQVVARLDRE